jgi:hypothetical protein
VSLDEKAAALHSSAYGTRNGLTYQCHLTRTSKFSRFKHTTFFQGPVTHYKIIRRYAKDLCRPVGISIHYLRTTAIGRRYCLNFTDFTRDCDGIIFG